MKLVSLGDKFAQFDNCELIYKNFSGRPGDYNREGDRNFNLVIREEDIARALSDAGLNVKEKPDKYNEGELLRTLKVKVNFNERGPLVYLISGSKRHVLDEESVGRLDLIDIANVDMDINFYKWGVSGKQGISAYLNRIEVTQDLDRFAEKWAEEESPTEDVPF